MMEILKILLSLILGLNIIGFIIGLFFSEKEQQERPLALFSFSVVLLIGLILILLLILHIGHLFPSYSIFLFQLMHGFSIDLLWNTTTLIFLMTGNIITLLILYFSSYYMHRENGFKRFFNTLMFFYMAYNITVLSGNFTTLFIGWEYLGISSFLLIGFYRDRYLPVRNSVKVFSVYRIADIGLIVSMWALHHILHENVLFYNFRPSSYINNYVNNHYYTALAIGLGILVASAGKSALFPFSYWLPRAMEGPTASSAIFYGSLSVHMGVLLLLKTYYLWNQFYELRILMFLVGSITYFTANKSAKLQSSIKPQIGYSSIAQIGIMYIELSLGLYWLVLIHFVSNAFLRTYQLIVSPSVAAYLMRQQVYFSELIEKIQKHFIHYLPNRLKYTLFVLAHNEWYLDPLINTYLFGTIKKIGRVFQFINTKTFLLFVLPLFVLSFYIHQNKIHLPLHFSENIYAILLSFVAVILIIRAFAERYKVFLVLYLILFSELFIALAVSYNEKYDVLSFLIYLSGIIPGFLIALICLIYLKSKEERYFDLNKYYGHIYEHRWFGFVFLISILSIIGFPITPTFLGEDIITEHIHTHQVLLAFNFAIHFILTGITGIKMYARLFLGHHCKPYHEIAIKSA